MIITVALPAGPDEIYDRDALKTQLGKRIKVAMELVEYDADIIGAKVSKDGKFMHLTLDIPSRQEK